VTLLEEAHPGFLAEGELPALRELALRCEASSSFAAIRQPLEVKR